LYELSLLAEEIYRRGRKGRRGKQFAADFADEREIKSDQLQREAGRAERFQRGSEELNEP
jgi:hypothetical protein